MAWSASRTPRFTNTLSLDHKAMIRDPRGIDNRSERNVKIVLILPTAMSLFCCASILSNQTSKSILSAEIQKEKEKRLIMIRNRCRCGMNISDWTKRWFSFRGPRTNRVLTEAWRRDAVVPMLAWLFLFMNRTCNGFSPTRALLFGDCDMHVFPTWQFLGPISNYSSSCLFHTRRHDGHV